MSFLTKIFKLGSRTTASAAPEEVEYAKWTKEQLIGKVLELEKERKRELKEEDARPIKKRKSDLDVPENSRKKKKQREFDFSKYNTRFIALKFAYLGWNYNGLAIQKDPTPLPTVEGTILEAMNKCRLVPSMIPQEYNFSRCGRTDKGVSAMNQVISLRVRSNLTDEEQKDALNDSKELQYVHILNQVLPDDIRVSAVCLRPPKGFDARFSCQHRHYKYLFHKDGLDIKKMEEAARLYEGEHDFRNFCKLDGSKQITNYKRTILSSKILQVDDDFYCFDLVGSAFLWHQVRCMMANLFLVGQKLEEPVLIQKMLDIEKMPRKPIYEMASDVPLILYDCKFPEMEWTQAELDSHKTAKYGNTIYSLALGYQLKATVSKIFKDVLPTATATETQDRTRINLGDGKGKVVSQYQKMLERGVMDSVTTVNEKFKKRKARNRK